MKQEDKPTDRDLLEKIHSNTKRILLWIMFFVVVLTLIIFTFWMALKYG